MIRIIIISLLECLLMACSATSQTSQDTIVQYQYYFDKQLNDTIYIKVDIPPVYTGSSRTLSGFIFKNLEVPNQEKPQTKLYFSFIVTKEGNVVKAKVPNKNEQDYTLLEIRIIELISKSSSWKPAVFQRRSVSAETSLPLHIDYAY